LALTRHTRANERFGAVVECGDEFARSAFRFRRKVVGRLRDQPAARGAERRLTGAALAG
jgi:hypothetical protein